MNVSMTKKMGIRAHRLLSAIMKLDVKAKVGLVVAGGLVVGGVALAVRRRYKKEKDKEETWYHPRRRPLTVPQVTKEIVIPSDHAMAFIGTASEHLRALEAESNTTIMLKDCPDSSKLCVIRGSASNVALAVHLVKDFLVHNVVKIVEVFSVPSRSVGRIMGEKGSKIRSLKSQFSVDVDFGKSGGAPETTVTIRGLPVDVAAAKARILEVAGDDSSPGETREKREVSPPLAITATEEPLMRVSVEKGAWANLGALGKDHPVEVLVSCADVDEQLRFWVQLQGPRAADLDRLSSDLDELQSKRGAHKEFGIKVSDLKEGYVVGFEADNCHWYRGMVCAIRPDDYSDDKASVDIFCVDYGRTETLTVSDMMLRRLSPVFLELQFQAIECCLAGVVRCSKRASVTFGKLANLGVWKPVMLMQVGEVDRPAEPPKQREPYKVPSVRLINHDSETPFDVGARLAEEGFVRLRPANEDKETDDETGSGR